MNFILGGAGFIGTHLVERIGGTVYDNLSVSNALMPEENWFQADVRDLNLLIECMRGYDTIWHLAASSDIASGNKFTNTDLNNNTVGTYNVLEAMRINKIEKLIFSSSATYYGRQPAPWLETAPPAPTSLYGASKVCGEALISAYASLFGIKAWVFRFGNVVGGKMGHGVLYDFIQQLKRHPEELIIQGDGTQVRPFFLIEDCIDGMLHGYRSKPDIYNLGCPGGEYTSITEVAKIVTEEMGLFPKIKYISAGVWDVPTVSLNTDKINSLGWKPKHSSEEAARIATRRLLGCEEMERRKVFRRQSLNDLK